MMFGLTAKKVIRKLDRQLDELALLNRRVTEHEELAEFALSSGIARLGDDFAVREWRALVDEMSTLLKEAKNGVQYGREDFREINNQLPALGQALGHLRRVIDETDQLAEAGRAAAHKRLGI